MNFREGKLKKNIKRTNKMLRIICAILELLGDHSPIGSIWLCPWLPPHVPN